MIGQSLFQHFLGSIATYDRLGGFLPGRRRAAARVEVSSVEEEVGVKKSCGRNVDLK